MGHRMFVEDILLAFEQSYRLTETVQDHFSTIKKRKKSKSICSHLTLNMFNQLFIYVDREENVE